MSKNNIKLWKETLKMLRKHFPISCPVVVRRVSRTHKGTLGATYFNSIKFTIYISIQQSLDGQIDAITHEWAHVKAIDEAYQHRGRWGELHGEIYQTWENWNKNNG